MLDIIQLKGKKKIPPSDSWIKIGYN